MQRDGPSSLGHTHHPRWNKSDTYTQGTPRCDEQCWKVLLCRGGKEFSHLEASSKASTSLLCTMWAEPSKQRVKNSRSLWHWPQFFEPFQTNPSRDRLKNKHIIHATSKETTWCFVTVPRPLFYEPAWVSAFFPPCPAKCGKVTVTKLQWEGEGPRLTQEFLLHLFLLKELKIKSSFLERDSLVAQTVKRLPAMQETWVWSLGQEDPLEKERATHSSIPAWKIPQTVHRFPLAVHGITKSQTRLSDFTFTFLFWVFRFNIIISGMLNTQNMLYAL